MRVCPICHTTAVSIKWDTDNLTICSNCTLTYTDSVPDIENLQQAYSQDYFIGATSDYDDYIAEKDALQSNFKHRVKLIKQFSSASNLFEIGCAYGFFLEYAQKHWNQVNGIDISSAAVAYAKNELGLNALCGTVEQWDFKPSSIDILVMWDTIEHLYDPVRALHKINAALKPDGIIALTTGDVNALLPRIQKKRWRLYQPNHLYYFSPRSIKCLFDATGFEILHLSYEAVYRSIREMSKILVWGGDVPVWRSRLQKLIRQLPFADTSIPLNTFDIMLVIARKSGVS